MVLVVLNWSSWSDHLTSVQNPKPAQPDQNETVFPTGLTHQTHMANMLSDLRGNLSMTRILNAQIMILYIGSSFSEGIILTVKVTVLGRNSQLANKILRALEYFPTFSQLETIKYPLFNKNDVCVQDTVLVNYSIILYT